MLVKIYFMLSKSDEKIFQQSLLPEQLMQTIILQIKMFRRHALIIVCQCHSTYFFFLLEVQKYHGLFRWNFGLASLPCSSVPMRSLGKILFPVQTRRDGGLQICLPQYLSMLWFMLLFLHVSWFSLCTLTSLMTEQNLSVNTFVTYQVRGGEESSHKYSFNNVPELMVNVKGSKFWTQTPSPLSYLGHWDLTLREQQFLRRRHLDLTLRLYCVCLVTSRNSRNVTG